MHPNNLTAKKEKHMNQLIQWQNRWNPFKEMDSLHHQLASLMGRDLGRSAPGQSQGETGAVQGREWAPLVNISEDDKEYVIQSELPGVQKDDISVTVDNGLLTIQGERRFEKEEKDRKYHRVERAYGKFTRSFQLPDDVDGTQVSAAFKDGILRVSLVKAEEAKPKSIDIKAN